MFGRRKSARVAPTRVQLPPVAMGRAAEIARAGLSTDVFEFGVEFRDFTQNVTNSWILQRTIGSAALEAFPPSGKALTIALTQFPQLTWTALAAVSPEMPPIEIFPVGQRLLVRWTGEQARPEPAPPPSLGLTLLPLPGGSAKAIRPVSADEVVVAYDAEVGPDRVGCVVRVPAGDATFGDAAGRAAFAFGPGGTHVDCLAVASTGEIVVGGRAVDADGTSRAALTRLTPGGLLDRRFGGGRPVLLGEQPGAVEVVHPLDDGHLVVVRSIRRESEDTVGITRYDGAGRPVSGADGRASGAEVGGQPGDRLRLTCSAGDGHGTRLYLGGRLRRGRSGDRAAVLAVDASGLLSPRFARGGWLTDVFGDRPGVVTSLASAVTPDGQPALLVLGHVLDDRTSQPTPALTLLDAAGGPVAAFGDRGTVVLPQDRPADLVGLAPQPDGEVLVVGNIGTGSNSQLLLFKMAADGGPSAAFGGGARRLDVGGPARLAAVAPAPAGGLWGALTVVTPEGHRPAVLRMSA